ncbi:MAG TPA: NADH-quinone oxidoreductase subunit C [Gammaproteobacteria bacterium]|nr:NADH-quinone oxidoreductase subunit C [Gammaproteobacteria bacterium]
MNVQELSQALTRTFASQLQSSIVVQNEVFGEVTIEVLPKDALSVFEKLRDDETLKFEQLIDVCGVDYSEYGRSEWATEETSSTGFSRGVEAATGARLRFGDDIDATDSGRPRFASVYHLLSVTHNHRLRVRVYCEDDAMPVVPSVIELWPSANWFEREAFDLFGIIYEGHPDLRRILTDYGFVGHPFRKDFPLVGHVEMKYDEQQKRVVYQPVSIEPRVLVPRVIRDDGRFDGGATSVEKGSTDA